MEEEAFRAVRWNKLDKLKTLLDNGTVPATITEKNDIWTWTLAHRAVENGHLEMLKYLVKKEPSLLVKNTNEEYGAEQHSLLELAVERGDFNIVKYLVEECNADIFDERPRSHDDYKGTNPIYTAVKRGKLKILKYLIKKGNVDLNAPFRSRKDVSIDIKYPKSLLFIADLYENRKNVLEYLLKETNIDVTVVDDNGDNILFFKEIIYNAPILQFILEKHKDKFDVNQRNHEGKTFLQYYISEGGTDTKFILYLVENKGVNVNITDEGSKLTLLHHAVTRNSPETCECLINLGVNIEAKDEDGDTALHWGAITGLVDVCEILIKHGANINQKNYKGDSPLHYVINGCYEKSHNINYYFGRNVNAKRMFASLINHGALVTQENNEDKTPIDYLISKGNLNGLKYLIRRGIIHINQENKHKETLVHLAAIYNQVPILDYLVRIKKANINTHREKRNGYPYDWQSPLHTALILGHYESSKYLMNHGAKFPDGLYYNENATKLYRRIRYNLETGRARRSIAQQSFSSHFQNPNLDHGRLVFEGANHSIHSTENPVFSMTTHFQFQFHSFLSLAQFIFSYIRGSSYQPPELLFLQRQIEDTTIEEAVNTLPNFKDTD